MYKESNLDRTYNAYRLSYYISLIVAARGRKPTMLQTIFYCLCSKLFSLYFIYTHEKRDAGNKCARFVFLISLKSSNFRDSCYP